MTVTINGVDYTSSIIAPSVKIDKEATYQDDIEFVVRTTDNLRAGMEIIWLDDTDIVFGGILQTPKKALESPTTLLQTVMSSGYKQILARRAFSIDDTDFNAGDAVQDLFDRFLSATGTETTEELTLGQIDTGAVISRKKGVFNGYKLFTELAESSAYRVWIKSDKSFYFTDKPAYTASSKEVTDDPLSLIPFSIFEYPKLTEDLVKYRTRQYVMGTDADGNQITGLAINAAEETRMAALFGSGVYGGPIVYDDNLKTQAECDAAAQALLDANSQAPNYLTIKTRDFIDVNQTVNVNLSLLNIINETYIVSKVSVRYDKAEKWLYYEATLRAALDTAAQQSSWTDDFNRGLSSRQTEGSVTRTSSGIKQYVQDEEPIDADNNDVFIDTNDDSNCDGPIETTAQPFDLENGYVRYASGTMTLSLPTIASVFAGTTASLVDASVLLRVWYDGSGTLTINSQSTDTFNDGVSTTWTTTTQGWITIGVNRTLTDWKVG